MENKKLIASDEIVISKIYYIRDQKVMLDSDLAKIYGVTTSRLNEQVRRNQDRFPEDFYFQLNKEEWQFLLSHFAIAKWGFILFYIRIYKLGGLWEFSKLPFLLRYNQAPRHNKR